MSSIPQVLLASSSNQRSMPVIGFGMAADLDGRDAAKTAVIEAIKLGYRHFDTAAVYGPEVALGEAISEALKLGLI